MASLIHFVRHGEVLNPDHVVYAALPGFGLSDLGRRQARLTARFLRSRPIVAVWSSPLERALATATPIAAEAGVPVKVDEDLIEWRMADDWAGIGWDDLPDRRPGQLEAYLEHPHDLPFASESLTALAERMSSVATRLSERHRDGDVVIVSHQDPVQAARLYLTGRPLDTQHQDKPRHASVISLRPGKPWSERSLWHPPEDEPDSASAEPVEQSTVGLEGQ